MPRPKAGKFRVQSSGLRVYYPKLLTLNPEHKMIMNKIPIIFFLFFAGSLLSAQDFYLEPPDPKSGYININELTGGYGLGSTDVPYSKYFYGFTTIHGYEFNIEPFNINSGLSIGAGAAMQFYSDGAMFPVIGDLRYTIYLRRISPFAFGNSGILLNIDNLRDQSMLTMNGGIGARVSLSDKLNLSIGTGLFVQFRQNDARDTFMNLRVGVTYKPGRKVRRTGMLVFQEK